ncbi:hypothetical protein MPSEU_000231600 [Mayamaea pseudoterrestris]|nr:hypothetical protein MPSEU_000231600 [Mayamaea pseudoterrestris]
MSDTASFVDPVFLARFGLSRVNAIDYFLHPLNPFRTSANTSNEVLAMQGISIGMLMQHGNNGEPMSPRAAEEEYNIALGRLTGEQYELLPPSEPSLYLQPSELFTIRHVLRTSGILSATTSSTTTNTSSASSFTTKLLNVYYIVQGVIYKSPPIRSIQKTHVARVLGGLGHAQKTLSPCARFHPAVGYVWVFENQSSYNSHEKGSKKRTLNGNEANGSNDDSDSDDDDNYMDPVALVQLSKRQRSRQRKLMLVDRRAPGQLRTPAEEEGMRASEAMDQILVRISKSALVATSKSSNSVSVKAASATRQR